ncbi:ketopantoate reductase PanE/ApbA C terminal-domain-containing protein [Gorgonomyces haynaldii]|nr:ketopantoate reductase PanE/ApbA C terminal-domain-containing protein [Gorgonomyces haynaldii]
MPLRILIVGAGSIGSAYGSRLHQPPETLVSCVCRSNYQQVKDHGFQFETTVWGNYTWHPEHVFKSVEEANLEWDHIIITTKAIGGGLPELVKPAVSPKTMIHLIHNGIGSEQPLIEAFDNPISLGSSHIASNQISSGVIRVFAINVLYLGLNKPDPVHQQKLDQLGDAFRSRQVKTVISNDVQEVRWHKLLWNASFNPISIVAGGKTSLELLEFPETNQLIQDAMKEVTAIAVRSMGHEFSPDLPDIASYLETTRTVGHYKPSMLQDWENKRPLEIEVILGNPIRIGEQLGVPCPILKTIYALLKRML